MKVVYDSKKEIGIIRIDNKEEFKEIKRAMDDAVKMSGRHYPRVLRNELIQIEYDNIKKEL